MRARSLAPRSRGVRRPPPTPPLPPFPGSHHAPQTQYLNPRTINTLLRSNGTTDAVTINAVINRLKTVNGMVCKSCKDKWGMQAVNTNKLLPGFSECCEWPRGYHAWMPARALARVCLGQERGHARALGVRERLGAFSGRRSRRAWLARVRGCGADRRRQPRAPSAALTPPAPAHLPKPHRVRLGLWRVQAHSEEGPGGAVWRLLQVPHQHDVQPHGRPLQPHLQEVSRPRVWAAGARAAARRQAWGQGAPACPLLRLVDETQTRGLR